MEEFESERRERLLKRRQQKRIKKQKVDWNYWQELSDKANNLDDPEIERCLCESRCLCVNRIKAQLIECSCAIKCTKCKTPLTKGQVCQPCGVSFEWLKLINRNQNFVCECRYLVTNKCDCLVIVKNTQIRTCICKTKENTKADQDFLYASKFDHPKVRPVNYKGHTVLNVKGQIMGPHTHTQWLEWGFRALEKFHDLLEGKLEPSWDLLYLRDERDFYGGAYSSFYPISVLLSRRMNGLANQHLACNDVSRGVDTFENLYPVDKNEAKTYRKTHLFDETEVHQEFCQEVLKIDFSKWDHNQKQQWLKSQRENDKRNAKLFLNQARMSLTPKEDIHFLPDNFQNFDHWYRPTRTKPLMIPEDEPSESALKPIFHTNPEKMEKYFAFALKTVQKSLISGALVMLPKNAPQPLFLSPLVFANLEDPYKKDRMCIDGSGFLNYEAYKTNCKLESLLHTQTMLEKDDLMCVTDDRSGFNLLRLNKESRETTAFSFIDGEGELRYFMYRALPFGIGKAPGSFQRVNMLAVQYAKSFGIPVQLYLDDRLIAENKKSIINGIPRNTLASLLLIAAQGGFLAIEKSNFKPVKIQKFLGFIVNTTECTIAIPEDKQKRIVEMGKTLLSQEKMFFKDLETFRGTVCACLIATPLMKLCIREMSQALALSYKDFPKNGKIIKYIQNTHRLKDEISEWIKFDILTTKNCWIPKPRVICDASKISFADASGYGLGIVIYSNNQKTTTAFFMPESLQEESIYIKEAFAMQLMLETYGEKFKNAHAIHFCDNAAVVSAYRNQGCPDVMLNDFIKMIYRKLHKLKASMTVYWCGTKEMEADEPSRRLNLNEEFLPFAIFVRLENFLNTTFTVDLMATRANAKCEKFISLVPSSSKFQIAVDVFNYEPNEREIYYIFPPFNFCRQVTRHIIQKYKKCKFALILHAMQEWPIGLEKMSMWLTVKIYKLHEDLKIGVIPGKHTVNIFESQLKGGWNKKPKATFIITNNLPTPNMQAIWDFRNKFPANKNDPNWEKNWEMPKFYCAKDVFEPYCITGEI